LNLTISSITFWQIIG